MPCYHFVIIQSLILDAPQSTDDQHKKNHSRKTNENFVRKIKYSTSVSPYTDDDVDNR